MQTETPRKYKILIWVLSFVLPLAIAGLFTVRIPNVPRLGFLPPIYATINGFTAVFLVLAVRAAKQKKLTLHKRLIQTCICFSVAFLVMYIAYHITSDSTDRKSTRLNSSHVAISYAVFCLKKKRK